MHYKKEMLVANVSKMADLRPKQIVRFLLKNYDAVTVKSFVKIPTKLMKIW